MTQDDVAAVAGSWAKTANDALRELGVSREKGLDGEQVAERLRRYGRNRLREMKRRTAWQILIDQFKSLVVGLLAAAAILSLVMQEWIDAAAIFAVIAINTAIGFFMEYKAVRSMEALRKMGAVTARVRRGGETVEIPADQLVPGDILIVEGGDIVSADVRLIDTSKLQADESALTGESVPVSKAVDTVKEKAEIAERKSMLFKGTAVTRGSGEAVVVATGMGTELGRISSLVEEAEQEATPLEKRLDALGRNLLWVTLGIMVIVAVTGIVRGKPVILMIETAVALAVAAIPEGLPIVATIALARGMLRMARRNALVNRLSAVETLGGTNVIFTDKTGTLTENRMTLDRVFLSTGEVAIGQELGGQRPFARDGQPVDPQEDPILREALEIGVLCNNASLGSGRDPLAKATGEPMEVALLIAGLKAGIRRDQLVRDHPEQREEAFDSDIKMMATYHAADGQHRVAVKGAPEAVLDCCARIRTADGERDLSDQDREHWSRLNAQMAGRGLRMLAVAAKRVDSLDTEPYRNLTWVALLGLHDPPRSGVAEAIEKCRMAGIRVIMVTGDQPDTARSIGQAVGLIEDRESPVVRGRDIKSPDELTRSDRQELRDVRLFARVSPKQKLDLIALHQEAGSIVAMTGDGVNDAPALKKAEIGVAMGQRGTQVAREASDMVLKDDSFATIVAAVEQGRVIFNNIRKFVLYLLSCNVSEVLVVFIASIVNAPLPILPLQILFLNLVTDVFPALSLGVGEGDPRIMDQPPRDPKEPVLRAAHWLAIGLYGGLITLGVLGAFWVALDWMELDTDEAITISFLTLAFAQLWHIFNMRNRGTGLLRNEITANPYVWGALGLCVGLLLAVTYVPLLAAVLQLTAPGPNGWAVVLIASLIPLAAGQVVTSLLPKRTLRGPRKT